MARAHDLHGLCRRRLVSLSGVARKVAALAKPGRGAFTLVKAWRAGDSSSRGRGPTSHTRNGEKWRTIRRGQLAGEETRTPTCCFSADRIGPLAREFQDGRNAG
jgi:hypothetical protein